MSVAPCVPVGRIVIAVIICCVSGNNKRTHIVVYTGLLHCGCTGRTQEDITFALPRTETAPAILLPTTRM